MKQNKLMTLVSIGALMMSLVAEPLMIQAVESTSDSQAQIDDSSILNHHQVSRLLFHQTVALQILMQQTSPLQKRRRLTKQRQRLKHQILCRA